VHLLLDINIFRIHLSAFVITHSSFRIIIKRTRFSFSFMDFLCVRVGKMLWFRTRKKSRGNLGQAAELKTHSAHYEPDVLLDRVRVCVDMINLEIMVWLAPNYISLARSPHGAPRRVE